MDGARWTLKWAMQVVHKEQAAVLFGGHKRQSLKRRRGLGALPVPRVHEQRRAEANGEGPHGVADGV